MSKDQITALLGVGTDATRAPAERLEALKAVDVARKERKASWAKFGLANADELMTELQTAIAAAGADNVVEGAVTGAMVEGDGEPTGTTVEGDGEIVEEFDTNEGPERRLTKFQDEVRSWLSGDKHLTAAKLASIMDVSAEDVLAAIAGMDDLDAVGDEGHEVYSLKAPAKPAPRARAAAKPAKPVDPNRGKVTQLTNELLMDASLSYADIVARIHKACTGANTTTRSVASVAAELRKKGVDVPIRRKEAAPKGASAAPAVTAQGSATEVVTDAETEADAALDDASTELKDETAAEGITPAPAEGEGEQSQEG